MEKLWIYISNLGTNRDETALNKRTIALSNQLNFVLLFVLIILLITTIVTLLLTKDVIYFGTLRVVVLLMVTFLNLVLSRWGYPKLSMLSLIYLPPVVFLLGPTLIGYVEEESYTYYPYTLICVSIIPQLLLHPARNKFLYWFSMLYYFILVLFIDKVMVQFGSVTFPIVARIETFYPFYKIAQIGIFIFINVSIYYLRRLNSQSENMLRQKNDELDLQNIELSARKEEIEKQKDELVNKEISTWQKLVNIISHEIVNSAIPITNLAGMTAQMLEDESGNIQKPEKIGAEVTDDIHHSLRIIESRTLGLINFVKATKSLTEIPKPNLRKIMVSELLDRITYLYSTSFKESGIKFEKEIVPPDLYIKADLELIEQVLINLIKNALEAMQETENPKLKAVASMIGGEHVHIIISDTGGGITPEAAEKIFLPFYSTKAGNSGIGLSLSQQIMMLHNGRIEVDCTRKDGASFAMVF